MKEYEIRSTASLNRYSDLSTEDAENCFVNKARWGVAS